MKRAASVFTVFLFTVAFASSFADARTDTLFIKGEDNFNMHCAKCHGPGGMGTDQGPPLIHKIYEPSHHGDMSFHMAVMRGVQGHHWDFGNMPRMAEVEKVQVNYIIYYIRTLQKEAGIY